MFCAAASPHTTHQLLHPQDQEPYDKINNEAYSKLGEKPDARTGNEAHDKQNDWPWDEAADKAHSERDNKPQEETDNKSESSRVDRCFVNWPSRLIGWCVSPNGTP